MVKLIPMEPTDFETYLKRSIVEYAEDKTAQQPRAADECQSHAWNASHTGFKFCPDCGNPLSTHR